MVQQVRHDDEQRRLAALDAAVGDRGGDVGLAGARGAVDQQPALRLLRERPGIRDEAAEELPVARVGAAALLDEVVEGQARQRPERAVALQPLDARLRALGDGRSRTAPPCRSRGGPAAGRGAGSRRRGTAGRRRLSLLEGGVELSSPPSVAVASEELGSGAIALARISSSLFTLASFRCPALQDRRGVAPGALVLQRRLAQRLLQPLVGVELLRLLQLLRHQRRERADVLFVELEDVLALRRPAPACSGGSTPAQLDATVLHLLDGAAVRSACSGGTALLRGRRARCRVAEQLPRSTASARPGFERARSAPRRRRPAWPAAATPPAARRSVTKRG